MRIFSFICPGGTMFSQMVLVCVWNDTMEFDCAESEQLYEQSNMEFSANKTAQMNINENKMNSTEISLNKEELIEVEDIGADLKHDAMLEEIKLLEIPAEHDLEVTNEEEAELMVEKNSIEEDKVTENISVEEETEESNEYQAELIPNGIDESVAESSASASLPQKVLLSIDDPIIEMPTETSPQARNIKKRSGSHFLFKADAHK